MDTIQIPLPTVDSLQLGTVATFKPDVHGLVLHGFLLQVVGTKTVGGGTGPLTFGDAVESVSLLVNNREVSKFDPALSAKYDGFVASYDPTTDASFFNLVLARPGIPWASWGTGDIQTLQIAVKLKASLPAGGALTGLSGGTLATALDGAAPPMGDVFLQTFLTPTAPISGINTINDLPLGEITRVTRLIIDDPNCTKVRLLIGTTEIYNWTVALALQALRLNVNYQVPAGTNSFPVMLDCMGRFNEFPSVIRNGFRRAVKVEYTTTSTTPFKILAEGVREAALVNTAKA